MLATLSMSVELVMQVSRGDDNRLSGTVRSAGNPDIREFSGTLELMRVFEELVPTDRGTREPGVAGDDEREGRDL
ncbi:MAG: hypothetical protein JO352_05580 [Chloroflexi bacterium]|nr:hypothetical protein [Chloroflexota bacterium]